MYRIIVLYLITKYRSSPSTYEPFRYSHEWLTTRRRFQLGFRETYGNTYFFDDFRVVSPFIARVRNTTSNFLVTRTYFRRRIRLDVKQFLESRPKIWNQQNNELAILLYRNLFKVRVRIINYTSVYNILLLDFVWKKLMGTKCGGISVLVLGVLPMRKRYATF